MSGDDPEGVVAVEGDADRTKEPREQRRMEVYLRLVEENQRPTLQRSAELHNDVENDLVAGAQAREARFPRRGVGVDFWQLNRRSKRRLSQERLNSSGQKYRPILLERPLPCVVELGAQLLQILEKPGDISLGVDLA